tara:strand:+ start:597 stop:737 length:141 start_codon:yes stop_codon:yes gene_type:complete
MVNQLAKIFSFSTSKTRREIIKQKKLDKYNELKKKDKIAASKYLMW